ncbi:MAG TPA: M2 family metallopeptidase, partial [Actinomycetes bacterium]|nr:M2 family metallopeptidase [Actinomycetes bacterium]
MPADPDTVLRRLTDRLAPLERDLHRAFWAASTKAGPDTSAARQRAEEAWLAALADPELFAEVQGALAADRTAGTGGLARRALEQAGLDLLANQIPEGDRAKLVALQAKVEHAFATVRGRVGDRQLANNELERILADSGDPAERRAAWEAGKQVGAVVADDVLALVELRNRVARERGHRDWFAFALATGDIDEAWLERMLDQVELATREPFLAVKAELDARLAARFGVAVDDLYPWHYGDLFFQRYDGDAEADLGPLLEGSDTVALTVAAYDGMGLETRHLLERSDLHPRPGKDQHAFCLDVDRAG